MANKFKPGDKARVIRTHPDFLYLLNKTCTLVTKVSDTEWEIVFDDGTKPPSLFRAWCCLEDYMEPIVKLGSWEELEATIDWNPTKSIKQGVN